MNNRIEWIDGLRAVAMLIVMIWHISNGLDSQWIFSVITAPIMIPLFFSITGYVFNHSNGVQTIFYSKLFRHIICPWLFLAILKGIVNAFFLKTITNDFNYINYIYEYFINLFNGSNLWYFPCCIIAEILFFYNLKYFKRHMFYVSIIALFLTLFGFLLSKKSLFDNLNLSTAFICQSFILVGYIIKNKSQRIKSLYLPSIFIIIYIIICTMLLFNVAPLPYNKEIFMDIHRNYYVSVPVCFILIIMGNVSIFYLFERMHVMPNIINFIGQNTIVFYVFHYDSLKIFDLVLLKMNIVYSNSWSMVSIKLLFSICVCILISLLFNRFVPQLVGKKK